MSHILQAVNFLNFLLKKKLVRKRMAKAIFGDMCVCKYNMSSVVISMQKVWKTEIYKRQNKKSGELVIIKPTKTKK